MSSRNKRAAEAQEWAEHPERWGHPTVVLSGAEATAHGRSALEAAGVDIEALERRVGRPRLGEQTAPHASRSPRINVAISPHIDEQLQQLVERRGQSRSAIVRAALAEYLDRAS